MSCARPEAGRRAIYFVRNDRWIADTKRRHSSRYGKHLHCGLRSTCLTAKSTNRSILPSGMTSILTRTRADCVSMGRYSYCQDDPKVENPVPGVCGEAYHESFVYRFTSTA